MQDAGWRHTYRVIAHQAFQHGTYRGGWDCDGSDGLNALSGVGALHGIGNRHCDSAARRLGCEARQIFSNSIAEWLQCRMLHGTPSS